MMTQSVQAPVMPCFTNIQQVPACNAHHAHHKSNCNRFISFTNYTSHTINTMVVLICIPSAANAALPLIYKLKEIALLQTKTPAPIKVSPVVCIGFLCYKTTSN